MKFCITHPQQIKPWYLCVNRLQLTMHKILHSQICPKWLIPTTVGIFCSIQNKSLLKPQIHTWFLFADQISTEFIVTIFICCYFVFKWLSQSYFCRLWPNHYHNLNYQSRTRVFFLINQSIILWYILLLHNITGIKILIIIYNIYTIKNMLLCINFQVPNIICITPIEYCHTKNHIRGRDILRVVWHPLKILSHLLIFNVIYEALR